MAELAQHDDDDNVRAYRDAVSAWVDSSSGRDLDKMAKGQLRDVAARLSFATNKGRDELRLPRRTRAKGDVVIIATRPTPDASLLENATTTSSLRLCWDDKELFSVQALATGAAPEFEELQVRTACDGRALIDLRLQALPLVDEPADVLNLLLALPWLPDNDLATHVRNRLMEDLLVDLCDIEGSESEHDCATEMDEAGGERPMVRRKTSESVPVAGQKRKK